MYQTPIRKNGETHIFNLGDLGVVYVTAYEKYKIPEHPPVYLAKDMLDIARAPQVNLPGFIRSYALKAPIARREGILVVDRRFSLEDDLMFKYVCYDQLDRLFLNSVAAAALLHYANEDIINGILGNPDVTRE